MSEQWLRAPGERVDDLGRAGLKMIQNREDFCFGTDAVLLAHFARMRNDARVLDLGCGNGILPLLLYGRYGVKHIVGIEIQPRAAELAHRNVGINALEAYIEIRQGDYRQPEMVEPGNYTVVVSNPPYLKLGCDPAVRESQRIAKTECCATLREVLETAARALRSNGKLYLVYRPNRLPELMAELLRVKLEPKHLRLVQPRAKSEPNLVLVSAVLHGKPGLQIVPPLILADEEGRPTPEVTAIYEQS